MDIDPKNHVAIATVAGSIESINLHEGVGSNQQQYSLLRLQVSAGEDQVAAVISASKQDPQRAQQAQSVLRHISRCTLRGFIRQETYQEQLTWTVQAFRWAEMKPRETPRAVFYVVGTFHELAVRDNGLKDIGIKMVRTSSEGEPREEFVTVIVWPEFDVNLMADKPLLIKGRMINRYREDDFGVPLDRSTGLVAEAIQLYENDSWSPAALRQFRHASPHPSAS